MQLAVELAVKFNGEIINCDALQLYKGLPVITNKITPEEQKGIQHHLLGCIGLNEQTWTVGTFIPQALQKVIPYAVFDFMLRISDIRYSQ
jgi:tRNA dimethylallyltransferase